VVELQHDGISRPLANPKLRVLSLGAGVQSTTIALMAARGEIPAPDCAIFADTGDEPRAVYEHLAWLRSPGVLPFPVHIVKPTRTLKTALVAGDEDGARIPWFVGVGGMGQSAHLKNYASIDDCEVVAISEVRPQLAQRVATRYGVAKVYATGAEMLAREKLDGIVASQPFFQHAALIPPLYQARLPVFTEKPLAESIESAEIILAALKASGTWHMVGYHKRSDPATMYAKAEIDRLKQTGEVGKLRRP